ncbi:hypothetical protein BGZ73_006457 [Actinomortierella ambigua]|nr:hypothetical protein BGZ73_006457 [Actinomortierella ambigua]
MRIFLIPLSRAARTLHCHSTLAPSPTSYLTRATSWAGKKWNELGESPRDSAKHKVFVFGTRVLDKLPHEEYFLKAVPAKEDWDQAPATVDMVPFTYPSAWKEARVKDDFRALVKARVPYHRKYMIYSAIWVPFTSLFAIVPLVPNFPLFYNAYRLWSHWKAYQGAKHLDFLIDNNVLDYQPSDVLNMGLEHDPEFSVFFTSSGLQSRKHASGTPLVQSTAAPTFNTGDHGLPQSPEEASTKRQGALSEQQHSPKGAAKMAPVDLIIRDGFITDSEIRTICLAFDQTPMHRELERARHQEADKILKKLLANQTNLKNKAD